MARASQQPSPDWRRPKRREGSLGGAGRGEGPARGAGRRRSSPVPVAAGSGSEWPSARRRRASGTSSPRTVSPLDLDTILESVEKTGRLVVVDEASPRCNIATDISAQVVSEAFGDLKAPVKMVSPPHVPVPFASALEDLYMPSVQDIVNAVKTVTEWSK